MVLIQSRLLTINHLEISKKYMVKEIGRESKCYTRKYLTQRVKILEIRPKKIGHIENRKGNGRNKSILITNYLNVNIPKLLRYSKSSAQRKICSCKHLH